MPKPGRKVWHLRIHGCNYEVVRRMDLEAEERFIERPHLSTSHFDRWLNEPVLARRLAGMLSSVMALPQRNALENRRWLSARLDDAFRKGQLVLLEQEEAPAPPASGGGGGQSQAQNTPPPAPPRGGAGAGAPAKTWIEFKLVDNDDKPIANERYKVKLTDGSTKEGHLSASGTVRFSNIDPGNCDISFPDLDARDWTAA